jgi:hypothetical protein
MSATASTVAPPVGWNPVDVFTKSARADNLVVGERRRLDDDLQDAGRGDDRAHRRYVGLDEVEAAGLGRADVDHHVDLVGAERDRLGGLGRLHGGGVLARGEAADHGELERRRHGQRQHRGGDADREGAELDGLGDERFDIGGGRLGLEQGVVDDAGNGGHGGPKN